MRRKLLIAESLAVLLVLTGCATPTDTEPRAPATNTGSPASPEPGTPLSEATVVRFTSGDTIVDVTIAPDNPAASDFVSMLPLTLAIEEYGGREKISYLPRSLGTSGTPGSKPENGDLSYYVPWGNLVFYYNTDGIGYSDQTIHLGTYNATPEQLAQLEGSNVTVEMVP